MKKMNKKGFTLVELVIVIAVIAILAAVLIPVFSGVIERAKLTAAKADVRNEYSMYTVAVAESGTAVQTAVAVVDDKYYVVIENGEVKDASTTAPANYTYTTGDANDVTKYDNSNNNTPNYVDYEGCKDGIKIYAATPSN